MKFAYSNLQMREADRAAVAAGTPVETLMERAGLALADALERAAQDLNVGEMLFVCGGGNNGGDGFVAARILKERGYDVSILCLAERFSAACAAAKARFSGEVLGRIPRRRYALIADCLIGTGLDAAPSGDAAALIRFINDSGAYVVACDLPSGLKEGGLASDPCVTADETVSMGQLKQALLLADGADTAGKLTVADIGIPAADGAEVWEDADVAAFFPKRKSHTHKGSYGCAYIFAGGAVATGAAFLSAGACLKSGCGYTKLALIGSVYPHAIGRFPSVILREFHAIDGEMLASDCLAVGMGSGVSERLYAYLSELLPVYTGTLVLDADALNTIALYGTEVLNRKSCRVVVTPHPAEFSRLTGKSVSELLSDPAAHAAAFARGYGVTVLFKNNRSVITDGVRTAINPTGSPALAKGGSGDVLSGFLTGVCARGVPPFEAACVSSYVLGRAGELAAAELGEYAPTASDVVDRLPAAMLSLR